jgi:hypothetical protein
MIIRKALLNPVLLVCGSLVLTALRSDVGLYESIRAFCATRGLSPADCAQASSEAAGSVRNWAYASFDLEVSIPTTVDGKDTAFVARFHNASIGAGTTRVSAMTTQGHNTSDWVWLPTSHPIDLTDPVVVNDLKLMESGAQVGVTLDTSGPFVFSLDCLTSALMHRCAQEFCKNLHYKETKDPTGGERCASLLLQQVGMKLREYISNARDAAATAAHTHWGGSFTQNPVQLEHTVGGFRCAFSSSTQPF